MLHTSDFMKRSKLNLKRQGRRETLKVVFSLYCSLRLEKQLVLCLVRENPELIFDTWTVAWSFSRNHSGKERRIRKTGTQGVMYVLIRMKYVTRQLDTPLLLDR